MNSKTDMMQDKLETDSRVFPNKRKYQRGRRKNRYYKTQIMGLSKTAI